VDSDFGKAKPLYKVERAAPFYAAWATPNIHDTRAGLRINAKCEVLDMSAPSFRGCIAEANLRAVSATWVGTCHLPGYIAGTHCVTMKDAIADPNRSAQLQRAAGSLRRIGRDATGQHLSGAWRLFCA